MILPRTFFCFHKKLGERLRFVFFWETIFVPSKYYWMHGRRIFFLFWRTFFSVLLVQSRNCLRECLFIVVFLGDKCFASTNNPHTQIFRRVSVHIWVFWGDNCFSSSTTTPPVQIFRRVSVHIWGFGGTVSSPVVLLIPTRECLGEYLFILFFFGR